AFPAPPEPPATVHARVTSRSGGLAGTLLPGVSVPLAQVSGAGAASGCAAATPTMRVADVNRDKSTPVREQMLITTLRDPGMIAGIIRAITAPANTMTINSGLERSRYRG